MPIGPTITVRMNTTAYGHELGEQVIIRTDPTGIPMDQMWRRRLKDRGVPCDIIKPTKKTKTKTKNKGD